MKILHIDDNSEITNVFSKILSLKKHDYTSVDNGQKGLELLQETDYDIVLLDLSMPNFSGFDVLKNLKEKGSRTNNILVMTAATLSEQEKNNLNASGIRGVLSKPVTLDKLMEEIQKATNSEIPVVK